MTWNELRANPVHRDEHGVLVVLEEIDYDTSTAVFRRAGESFTVHVDEEPPRERRPATEFALEVQVLTGEVVDEDDEPAAPTVSGRARVVAAGVAAAGLALLAARRRR